MDRARDLPLALTALLLLTAAAPAAAGPGGFYAPGDIDPDSVSITVALQSDGDAAWTVQYRTRLRTDNETAAFRDLQQDIRQNTSVYRQRFASRIDATVRAAENATGREMAATNYTVTADIQQLPQTYGVVTYTFDWQQFATTNATAIRAGDAISGFYVDNETTLQFTWPDRYRLASVTPQPDTVERNSVGWTGRDDFTSEQPRLVVTTTPADGVPGAVPVSWLAALVLLLVVAAGGFLAYRAGVLGGASESSAESGPSHVEEGAASPPPELLSNEEQVEQFLRERGGRAKQQELVEHTGWTEAKTSQVLSKMRDADRVESFRIGRENVLRLPEEDEEDEK